jgi:hypothetical protein
MHNKIKKESVIHGQGFIQDITGLVRVVLEGCNQFFDTFFSKGRWLLIVWFVVFTVPFLMKPDIRDWMSLNARWLVTEIATNQRKMVEVQSQADQLRELVSVQHVHEVAALHTQLMELKLQVGWMRNVIVELSSVKPEHEDGSVEVKQWLNQDRCSERKPNQYSFDDGCDYGSM